MRLHTHELLRSFLLQVLPNGFVGSAPQSFSSSATARRGSSGAARPSERRQASGGDDDVRFHHFRDKNGYEVDMVLERSSRQVAGVEVKAAATVTAADFRGLRKLASAVGRRFAGGVVLYDGETGATFGDHLYAVPIGALWET